MPSYDSNLFDPPAPIAVVSLRDPRSGDIVGDVRVLMDSGSDLTLIPRRSVNELNLEINPNEGFELEGFDGRTTTAQAIQLDLIFAGRAFRGKYVIVDSNLGILGRDVLNHVALLLDGPHLSWSEQKESTE